ncbi:MAG TPA: efflux transporter outer membrane subunit [Rhodanobacteraceae bacterium]|nr:efflux transporter outer membrane subunit [Rhodanobacteraceae bacterium]
MSKMMPALRRAAVAIAVLALAGCAVGPNYREPAAPAVDRYTVAPLPKSTTAADTAGGDAQAFLEGQNVPRQWWTAFGNAELDRRVQQAFAHSPTVAGAQAALRQAEETARAARGGLFPSLDANAGATRQKQSGAQFAGLGGNVSGSKPFNVINAGVSVGYVFDLFGGVRRGIEAQDAEADVQRAKLDATYLMLATNVVTASLQEASLREQVQSAAKVVDDLQKELAIAEQQQAIGSKSFSDTLAVRTELATAAVALPGLRQQLAATQNQLATYLGVTPAQLDIHPITLDQVTLPADIPVSLPSTVVAQRPDIRAAAAQLHAATAAVGVATADMLPRLTLSGSAGSQALHSGDLFSTGTGAWSIGLNILQPLFHGGQLLHQKRAAKAGMDVALANWQQVVLTSFQNVADSLQALEYDAASLKALATADHDASKLLDLTRKQYRIGAVGYVNLLTAEQAYQTAHVALIKSRTARLADTAALYAALGGGWRDDPQSRATEGRAATASTPAKTTVPHSDPGDHERSQQ